MAIEWKTSAGLTPYLEAVAFMEERAVQIRREKAKELVWLLEHPPLYTAGTSAKPKDLIDAHRFPVYEAGRGGQYTYHGPGQRVAYVLLDLKERAKPKAPDLRRYVQQLEQWLIHSLARLGVKADVREGRIGVWVDLPDKTEAKIGALGIRVKQWVTYHGIALNVNPDLSHFSGIVPCGISEHGVTSLKALGINVDMNEVDKVLKNTFKEIF